MDSTRVKNRLMAIFPGAQDNSEGEAIYSSKQ
jgi:hypothetical protein